MVAGPPIMSIPIAAQIAHHMMAFREAASQRGDIMGMSSGSAKIGLLQDAQRSIRVTFRFRLITDFLLMTV
jgi:hypothetical protein